MPNSPLPEQAGSRWHAWANRYDTLRAALVALDQLEASTLLTSRELEQVEEMRQKFRAEMAEMWSEQGRRDSGAILRPRDQTMIANS